LNRRNDYAVNGIEVISLREGGVVELVERMSLARRKELLKLFQGLNSEVRAINQEADTAGARKSDQMVREVWFDERLSRSGRHLNQRFRLRQAKRLFQIQDGGVLLEPQSLRRDFRHRS